MDMLGKKKNPSERIIEDLQDQHPSLKKIKRVRNDSLPDRSPFEDLPDELREHIFSYLDLHTLLVLEKVCLKWKNSSRLLTRLEFGNNVQPLPQSLYAFTSFETREDQSLVSPSTSSSSSDKRNWSSHHLVSYFPGLRSIVDIGQTEMIPWDTTFQGHPNVREIIIKRPRQLPVSLLKCPELRVLEFISDLENTRGRQDFFSIVAQLMPRLYSLKFIEGFSSLQNDSSSKTAVRTSLEERVTNGIPRIDAPHLRYLGLLHESVDITSLHLILHTFSFPNLTTLSLGGFRGPEKTVLGVLASLKDHVPKLTHLDLNLKMPGFVDWVYHVPDTLESIDFTLLGSCEIRIIRMIDRLKKLRRLRIWDSPNAKCVFDLRETSEKVSPIDYIWLEIPIKPIFPARFFPRLKTMKLVCITATQFPLTLQEAALHCPNMEDIGSIVEDAEDDDEDQEGEGIPHLKSRQLISILPGTYFPKLIKICLRAPGYRFDSSYLDFVLRHQSLLVANIDTYCISFNKDYQQPHSKASSKVTQHPSLCRLRVLFTESGHPRTYHTIHSFLKQCKRIREFLITPGIETWSGLEAKMKGSV